MNVQTKQTSKAARFFVLAAALFCASILAVLALAAVLTPAVALAADGVEAGGAGCRRFPSGKL